MKKSFVAVLPLVAVLGLVVASGAKAEQVAPLNGKNLSVTGEMFKDLVFNVKGMQPLSQSGLMTAVRRSPRDARRFPRSTVNSYEDLKTLFDRSRQVRTVGHYSYFFRSLSRNIRRAWEGSEWPKSLVAKGLTKEQIAEAKKVFGTLYLAREFGVPGFLTSLEGIASATQLPKLRLWFIPTNALSASASTYLPKYGPQGATFLLGGDSISGLKLSLNAYKRADKVIPINSYHARKVFMKAVKLKYSYDLKARSTGSVACPAVTVFHSRKQDSSRPMICVETSKLRSVRSQREVTQAQAKDFVDYFGLTIARVNKAAVKATKSLSSKRRRISESEAWAATGRREVAAMSGKSLIKSLQLASRYKDAKLVDAPSVGSSDLQAPDLYVFSPKLGTRFFIVRQVDALKAGSPSEKSAVSAEVLSSLAEASGYSVARFNNLILKVVKQQ